MLSAAADEDAPSISQLKREFTELSALSHTNLSQVHAAHITAFVARLKTHIQSTHNPFASAHTFLLAVTTADLLQVLADFAALSPRENTQLATQDAVRDWFRSVKSSLPKNYAAGAFLFIKWAAFELRHKRISKALNVIEGGIEMGAEPAHVLSSAMQSICESNQIPEQLLHETLYLQHFERIAVETSQLNARLDGIFTSIHTAKKGFLQPAATLTNLEPVAALTQLSQTQLTPKKTVTFSAANAASPASRHSAATVAQNESLFAEDVEGGACFSVDDDFFDRMEQKLNSFQKSLQDATTAIQQRKTAADATQPLAVDRPIRHGENSMTLPVLAAQDADFASHSARPSLPGPVKTSSSKYASLLAAIGKRQDSEASFVRTTKRVSFSTTATAVEADEGSAGGHHVLSVNGVLIPKLPLIRSRARDLQDEEAPEFVLEDDSQQPASPALLPSKESPVVSPSKESPVVPLSKESPADTQQPSSPPIVALDSLSSAANDSSNADSHKRSIKIIQINSKRYQILEQIGKGGSSRVFKVIGSNFQIYALKRVRLKGIDRPTLEGYLNEIDLLQRLAHNPWTIQLLDTMIDKSNGYLYLLMEYGEIDLANLLQEKRKELNCVSAAETAAALLNFVRYAWEQMLRAVHSLHAQRIVHCDLKPANFLLVRGTLKLIDFGISKAMHSAETTSILRENQVGTINYMAPETLTSGGGASENVDASNGALKIGKPSDVWSLGCILYEIVFGAPPFASFGVVQRLHKIVDYSYTIPVPFHPNGALVDCIKGCLQRDQSNRLTIPALLQHEFLKS